MDDTTHRRFNPLTGRWVLVSPGRVRRPWHGGQDAPVLPSPAAHDPHCDLCPGNRRAGGARNPDYRGTYVFTNDFPALRPAPNPTPPPGPGHIVEDLPLPSRPSASISPSAAPAGSTTGSVPAPGVVARKALLAASDSPGTSDSPAASGSLGTSDSPGTSDGAAGREGVAGVDRVARAGDVPAVDPTGSGLLRSAPAHGTCRVICFGPDHGRGLVDMSHAEVRAVVETWAAQDAELSRRWRWVQIFENRGTAMGASNLHPHGQVWACDALPDEAAAEDTHQREHYARSGRSLLLDYIRAETAAAERIVLDEEDWLVVVPYWAMWPFETLLLPRRPVTRLAELDDTQRSGLAHVLGRLLTGYDALFDYPFPFSMGWHGAPGPHPTVTRVGAAERPETVWQLHAHVYPPLLRSPTIRKHVVGYEMFAEPARDMTPEDAAGRLRTVMSSSWDSAVTLPPSGLTMA
ncbi:galactose-1-phosphate uridylyltransferase, partial [Candidatus Frankia nodulisporulans]